VSWQVLSDVSEPPLRATCAAAHTAK